MNRVRFAAFALVMIVLPARVAASEVADPFEQFNRGTLAVNHALDVGVLAPTATVYSKAVPKIARAGVRNFLNNLEEPRTALNQCLQGKFGYAVNDMMRFVVNSAIGVGGLSTSIYTTPGPGGYNLIGRTPVPLWDTQASLPAYRDRVVLLDAADRVKFVPPTPST